MSQTGAGTRLQVFRRQLAVCRRITSADVKRFVNALDYLLVRPLARPLSLPRVLLLLVNLLFLAHDLVAFVAYDAGCFLRAALHALGLAG